MNEKFSINAKVEKFTTMLGIAVRLIIIDPKLPLHWMWETVIEKNHFDGHMNAHRYYKPVSIVKCRTVTNQF